MQKLILITVIHFFLCSALPQQNPAYGSTIAHAVNFELKDQYNNKISYSFPRDKVTVLTFGDRKGAEQIEGWVRPLWDNYEERIYQKGIAVLSSVPRLMRGMVRMIFSSQIEYPVLLDWEGDVSRAYGYEEGVANLYVIDCDGNVVFRTSGPADKDRIEEVFMQIDKVIR